MASFLNVDRWSGLWSRARARSCALLLVSMFLLVVGGDRVYPDEGLVRLTIRPSETGVLVHYELPSPVSEFRFEAAADAGITSQFSVTGDGLRFENGRVFREDGREFDGFDLLMREDLAERDRVYAALVRLGENTWAVYVPYLSGSRDETFLADCELCFDQALSPRSFSSGDTAANGFVIVGKPSSQTVGSIVMVNDGHVPRWLVRHIERSAQRALDFHEGFFGSRPPGRLVIAISQSSSVTNSWRGDVAQNGVILLRIKSDTLKDEQGLRRQLARFVAHEVAHLWIGSRYRLRNEADQWLSEGAAEYAALDFALHHGYLEGSVEEELTGRLNDCARELGDQPFSQLGQQKGSAVYNCGVLVQWWLDLELRAGGANSSLASLWKWALGRADSSGGQFDSEDVFSAAQQISGVPLTAALLFLEGGDGRWPKLLSRLRELGVLLREDASPAEWRAAALMPFLNAYCGSETSFGYWEDDREVKLDTGAGCGALSNGPTIVAMAEVSLVTAPKEVFYSARRECSETGAVWFKMRDSGRASIACRFPLLEPDHMRQRQRLLQHLLRQACSAGPIGYIDLGEAVRLDTGQRCGPLSGDPTISAVGGYGLADDISAAWETVRARCQDGRPIELTGPGSSDRRSMICRTPLETFQPAVQVEQSPVPLPR